MIRLRTLGFGSFACLLGLFGCSASAPEASISEGDGSPSAGGALGVASGGAGSAGAGVTNPQQGGRAPSAGGAWGGSTASGANSGKADAGAEADAGAGAGASAPAIGGAGGSSGAASAGAGGRAQGSGAATNTGGRAAAGSGGTSAGASNGARAGAGGGSAGRGSTGKGGAGGAAGSSSGGSGGATDPEDCGKAKRLWFEDFETGNYDRWTSKTYDNAWGNDCQSNARSTEQHLSGSSSQRSEISCAYSESHRGYGGLQFDGDKVVPAYTNQGTGIDAPHGVVNTFHVRLESPTAFVDGKWFSVWTIDSSCAWKEDVLTLGLEDSSNRLAVAHYWAQGGGEHVYAEGAPAFPRDKWVRVTIYVNYYDQEMHIWQDGKKVSRTTFDRPSNTICQWHWGAYGSGSNDDVVLYEDDNSLWKLNEPWTDFSREPWFAGNAEACE